MNAPIELRPELSLPTGERLKTCWLIGMALAEGLSQPRVPKEGEAASDYPIGVDDDKPW